MTLLQHHVLACSLTSVTTFCLGFLVFASKPKRKLNQVFFAYSLAIACWSFLEIFYSTATDQETAEKFLNFAWIGISLIAPCFLHSVLLLTESNSRKLWTVLKTAYFSSLIFSILQFWPGVVTSGAHPVGYTRFYASLTLA